MAEITWTREAEIWMKDIYTFIARDNADIAAQVIEGIYEKAQMLKQHPKAGHIFHKEEEGEVRILLYGHYRITYLLTNISQIKILGVFHGALEIDRYLP